MNDTYSATTHAGRDGQEVTRSHMHPGIAPDVPRQQQISGGALRFTHGLHDREDVAFSAPQMTRVAGETVRVTVGGGSSEDGSSRATSHTFSRSGTPGGSIASTLHARASAPSVELIPGDPTSRTSVESAHRMGLIERDGSGGWRDVQGQHEAAEKALAEPEQEPQADPGAGFFSHSEDREFDGLIADLPQHSYDAAAASLVNAMAHGNGTVETIAQSLAKSAGIDPAQAAEVIDRAHQHYSRVVARTLAPLGLTGDRFDEAMQYAQDHAPDRLQDAIQRLMHARDTAGFRALAVEFKTQRPGDLSMWHSAGFETSIARDTGDVLVKRPGGEWRRASDLTK